MNGISTYNYNAEVLDHGCLSAEGDVGRDKKWSHDTSKFIQTLEVNQHTSIDSESFLIKPLHNIEQFKTVNY